VKKREKQHNPIVRNELTFSHRVAYSLFCGRLAAEKSRLKAIVKIQKENNALTYRRLRWHINLLYITLLLMFIVAGLFIVKPEIPTVIFNKGVGIYNSVFNQSVSNVEIGESGAATSTSSNPNNSGQSNSTGQAGASSGAATNQNQTNQPTEEEKAQEKKQQYMEDVISVLKESYGVTSWTEIPDGLPSSPMQNLRTITENGNASRAVVIVLNLRYLNTTRQKIKNTAEDVLERLKDKTTTKQVTVSTADNYYIERAEEK
jgi:hypothetical protein